MWQPQIDRLISMTVSLELPNHIVARAYVLEPEALDACAARIGCVDWADLSRNLKFTEVGSGGGLSMLTAHCRTIICCN